MPNYSVSESATESKDEPKGEPSTLCVWWEPKGMANSVAVSVELALLL